MTEIFSRYQVSLLLIVWLAAVISTAGASMSVIHAVKAKSEAEAQSGRRVQIEKKDDSYPDVEIKNIVTQVGQLYPGVNIESSGDLVRVKSKSLTDYVSWRLAISDVIQAFPGATVKSLCAGSCVGSAFSAEISARLVRFVVPQ